MKNLVDKVKTGARNLAVGVGIGLAAMAYSPKAEAGITFADLVGNSGIAADVENFIEKPSLLNPDNLMIRDSQTEVDSIVPRVGANVWRIGFAKYDGNNLIFGAYANNINGYSGYEGYQGWCNGKSYSGVFAEGESAEEVMIIHDQLGDGIGNIDGGVWTLGADDIPYWTEDIEFNGVQGDISQVSPFTYSGSTNILPHMVVNPVPEPATLGILGMGAVLAATTRKRKYVESKTLD